MNDDNQNITNQPQDQAFDPANNQSDAGQYPEANQQQPVQPISTGSPEGAPMPVAQPEAPSENIEYGYEAIRQIEQAPEAGGAETGKEAQESQPKPQQPAPSQQQPKKPEPIKVAPKPEETSIPKFYGYQIAPQFINNLGDLTNKKKVKDTHDANSWVVVLLERMLRKQQNTN